ncbi:MAG: DUF4245 domain-containing protein [Actinobacteria bacterium]|nr:DUF4245 domain-containing protein [Actinomycetota bacterium]
MANKKPRGRETAWDMILSMSAVIATVGVIMLIAWRPQQEVKQQVDYESAVASAVLAQTWPISIPKALPTGYQATSARLEAESYGEDGDIRWILGFQTSANEYVSLWQSDGPVKSVVSAATNSATCASTLTINEVLWQKCEIDKPLTRAYVKSEGDVTSIVSGTASWEELLRFTESLVLAKP